MTKTNMKPPKPIGTLRAIDQRLTAFVGLRRQALGKDLLLQADEYTKMINELLDDRLEITNPASTRMAA